MSTLENLFPEYIRLDGDTQPREQISQTVCEEYGDRMRAGEKFPPIDVFFDGENYWLADGFHRLHACITVFPSEAIAANVFQGTQQDAQWHSYSANKAHGQPRSNEDKARAVRTALTHPKGLELSDSAIAEHVGVSQPFVSSIRKKLAVTYNAYKSTTRKGRDGRTTNTARIGGKRGRKERYSSDKPSHRMAARIQQPTRMPTPMARMTALNMPHDPAMGARTLIEVFDSDYLRVLVSELSNHLKGLPS